MKNAGVENARRTGKRGTKFAGVEKAGPLSMERETSRKVRYRQYETTLLIDKRQ